ncbi:hypothetical protein [Bradyrhizobium commune]|uniref:Uncharacterized protein n=1 Tax=Bradyrhizobium commune TaxID=83627 RepID=A0A7S9GXV0_9BRAD|nr:hypothetical protein [Bradyrhizobium commune]QPF90255.1 hypothetical protein IC761_27690 [Bradyrhizobium commune]
MFFLGIILFVAGLSLCVTIAWAPLGLIVMGLGLIFTQVAIRRPMTAGSHEKEETAGPFHAVVVPMGKSVSPTVDPVGGSQKSVEGLRWKSIVVGDPELAQIERTLAQYGSSYVDKFAKIYVFFNNKALLPFILNLIIESVRQAAAIQEHASTSGCLSCKGPGEGLGVDDPLYKEADSSLFAAEEPISRAQSPRASTQFGQSGTTLPVTPIGSAEAERTRRSIVSIEESDSLHRIFDQLSGPKR